MSADCRWQTAVACVLLLLGCEAVFAQDLSTHFDGISGTFVLLDGRTGQFVRHNAERARQRFAPCSTFKIPNTAIFLETGAAPDPEFLLEYDPSLAQQGAWARDHTLRSAFRFSTVWYYVALTRRVGTAAEARFLKQFAYGNESVAGGLDGPGGPFWLDGSLRISADEQVAFLQRLYKGELGLSEQATALAKDVMLAESTPRWRLSAKTGACRPAGEDATMWYVGFVERESHVFYFALQLGATEFGALFEQRVSKAKAILTELGVID